MITLKLDEEEASYLRALMKNETLKASTIMRGNKDTGLASYVKDRNKLNGKIGRKITLAMKVSEN